MTETQQKLAFLRNPKIDPADEVFGMMMCSAVRYAIGRMTYIVDTTTKYVEKYMHYMDQHALQNICDDITKNEEFNNLGMGVDRAQWLHLRQEIIGELQARNV